MKRIILFAAVAVGFLAGCATTEDAKVASEIKVRFAIAEKAAYGADAKAVKEDWAPYDMIRVALSEDPDGNSFPYLTDNAYTISFLRQDDGTWRAGTGNLTPEMMQDLNGYGVYKAIYYPGGVNFGTSTPFGTSLKDYKGGEYMAAEGEYEIVGGVLELKGVIEMKRPEQLMQISVRNLVNEGGDWNLTVEKVTSGDPLTGVTHLVGNSLELDSQVNLILNPNNNTNALGVKYGNDVSFCFYVDASSNISEINAFKFILTDGVKTYTYSKICNLAAGRAYLLPSLASQKEVDGELVYNWKEIN